MTTSSVMSLPADIAWKRLAFDEEMMWRLPAPGHPSVYPPLWVPSVTIFYACPDPDLLPAAYDDTTVTYLKVVSSVTGTTLLPGEAVQGQPWPVDSEPAQVIASNLTRYFGCYGALLEIDVVPYAQPDADSAAYPYFLDFEPKKRELYEAVTQSGETLSDSKETLSVRKSSTNLASQERAVGALPSTVPQFKAELKEEEANVRNIDASREARETVSHTTQLSQMYHLLDSYHLGTNRALFYLQPRPHDVDPRYQSFLTGPRRLEGIQETFLVVAQPKSRAGGLCVSANLSTGHLAFGKTEPTGLTPQVTSDSVSVPYVTAPSQGAGAGMQLVYSDPPKKYELGKELWPAGLAFDEGTDVWIDSEINKGATRTWDDVKDDATPVLKGPGWTLTVDVAHCKQLSSVKDVLVHADATGVTIETQMVPVKVGDWTDKDGDVHTKTEVGKLQATLTVGLKVSTPGLFGEGQDTMAFFVRSKSVGACLDGAGHVVPHPTDIQWHTAAVGLPTEREPVGGSRATASLRVLRTINARVAEAIREASERLYAHLHGPGPVSNPLLTDYALDRLRRAVPHLANREWLETPVSDLAVIDEEAKRRLAALGFRTRRELIEAPLGQLRERFRDGGADIAEIELRQLQLGAWDLVARGRDS